MIYKLEDIDKKEALDKLPKEVNLILVSSLVFFIASHISLRLFGLKLMGWPSTYSKFILPIYLLIFFSTSLKRATEHIEVRTIFALLFVVGLCAIYFLNFSQEFDKCKNPQIYPILSAFNESILIGGHPSTLDCIPLFSKSSAI